MTAPTPETGTHAFLTRSELAELPNGTEVVLTWSGGNGAHHYKIHQHLGSTYAVPLREWSEGDSGRLWLYNPITFVGPETFHTRVEVVQ